MHILHLEDDGPLREILATALKAFEPNCELQQFVESDKAVEYAQQHAQAIDLFILDIRVPGSMDGVEVARQMRAINCPGTIVLTSAYTPPNSELIKDLNCEWFPKPWHIYETVNKLLTLSRKKATTPEKPPVLSVKPPVSPAKPLKAAIAKPPVSPAKPPEATAKPPEAPEKPPEKPASSVDNKNQSS